LLGKQLIGFGFREIDNNGGGKKKKREMRRRHKNTISIGNDLAYYLNMSE